MTKILAWSWSRLDMFEQCPRKFYGTNISKEFPKPNFEAPHFAKGKAVHKVLENYLIDGKPMPYPIPYKDQAFFVKLDFLLPMLDMMRKAKVVAPELQITYNVRMQEVSWFDKKAWCRVIIDALIIQGDTAFAIDWKTGKVKQHSDQLKLFAGAIFTKYPGVKRVLTAYVWAEHPAAKPTIAEYSRDQMADIWQEFGDRQEMIQMANESGNWPAKPNNFCKWCDARPDQCEHKPA
jgi:hypothetical protein